MFDQVLTVLVIGTAGAMMLMALSVAAALVRSRRNLAIVAPWSVPESSVATTESVYAVQDAVAEPCLARAA